MTPANPLTDRFYNLSADLFYPAAADAGGADLHSFGRTVVINADRLDVGFERTRRNFHHVHTDTTFFLGKTSADDSCSLNFFLAANFADIAHCNTSICMLINLVKTMQGN